MSKLLFEWKGDVTRSLPWRELPVEVRKADAALVGTTILARSLEIENAGTYFATVKLPNGREITKQFEVVEHQQAVTLPLAFPIASSDLTSSGLHLMGAHQTEEKARHLMGAYQTEEKARHLMGAHQIEEKARFFSGNPLTGRVRYFVPDIKRMQESPGVLRVPPSEVVQALQIVRSKESALNVFLPTGPGVECTIKLTQGSEGAFPEVHLQHSTADLIVQYGQASELGKISAIITYSNFGEILLKGKFDDPIAAAVGAYVLLKFGRLEQLHDWTENLRRDFPWLPDGVPIRAEHLARRGQHGEALHTLMELPDRGLPIFPYGLSYAIDRLRLYGAGSNLDSESARSLDVGERARAQELAIVLQRYANRVDFQQPFLTMRGLDPCNLASNELQSASTSFDLADCFREPERQPGDRQDERVR